MSQLDKNQVSAEMTRYRPLTILVVLGAFGLIAWDAFVSTYLPTSMADSLQTIARLTLGAFLYRGMLRSGLLAHLNEPFGNSHPSNNKGEVP